MADDKFDPTSLLKQIFEIDRKMDGLKELARRTSLADAAVAVSVAHKNWAEFSFEPIDGLSRDDVADHCDMLRHILDDARIVLLEVAERCTEGSVPPTMFSERDAYELLRIRTIVREEASIRHGDLPGEPSWGVVADSVLAHASQHRLARDRLKVPADLTLDQHVGLLLRRPMLYRRIAEQAREDLTIAFASTHRKRIAELELEIVRLTDKLVAASAPRDPARKVTELEQIAAQTAIAVLEELAPRADAKALFRVIGMAPRKSATTGRGRGGAGARRGGGQAGGAGSP